MFTTNDHKTGYLFDPWEHLGPKRRKMLEESWAGIFRKYVLTTLPVDSMIPFFHRGYGRPTKEMYTCLGAVVLQQMHDLSDEEVLFELSFNEAWHYALDILGESDDAKYLCPKTLWNIRKLVTDNELDGVLFRTVTDKLAEVFKVEAGKQRLDSVHIKSNMRRLGRIGIFVKSLHKFLVNLKRQQQGLFDAIPSELVSKYLTQQAVGCFSFVKPSESEKTLASLAADLFDLVCRFSSNEAISGMSSYKLLKRVLDEQCTVTGETDGGLAEVRVKFPKEVPSDSLQNPSDPDATYDGHKGQGYQVQVMETYTDGDAKDAAQLNLITHVAVEQAHESDVHALVPAVSSVIERDLAPKQLLADSLYGSDENHRAAQESGVELISPVMGRTSKKELDLSDFELSEHGSIITCPDGKSPVRTKTKKTRHTAAFRQDQCLECPLRASCPVRPGKKRCYLRYDDKAVRIAERRKNEQLPMFKERYRYRAGVEATMSELDRRTGIKQLRVRGMPSVRMCATLKALGVNIFRAASAYVHAPARFPIPFFSFKHAYYGIGYCFLAIMGRITDFSCRLYKNWRRFIAGQEFTHFEAI